MSVAFTPMEARLALDPMLPQPAVIEAIKPEAAGIGTFTLAFSDPTVAQAFRFAPGQFNMLYVPGFGEVAISLSSDPSQPSRVGHTIRYAGNVTRALARLKVGDLIGVRGPYGSVWPLEEGLGKNLVVVGGGIGLAPLRPLILAVLQRRAAYQRVVLLYGARTSADLLYREEYESWQKQGIELHITVDIGDEKWPGLVGVVPMLFYRIRMDAKQTLVLACGPEIMMRFAIYEALARRISKDSVYVSMERNMKCAVGFCGHCQYGPTFLCKQGPVLKFSAIEPFFGREDF
jgi:NAD(P)H-flavin reductase